MRIVKNGDLDKFHKMIEDNITDPRLFKCNCCGCEFYANKNERKFKLFKFGTYAYCPTCNQPVRQYVDHSADWY